MARFANARARSRRGYGGRDARLAARDDAGATPAGPGCRRRRTCASPEAALAYPGTCLLEATNATEGRGTEAPFLLLGAPWLDAPALVAAVSRAGLRAATPHVHAARVGGGARAEAPGRPLRGRPGARHGRRRAALQARRALLHALRASRVPLAREGALDWLVGTRRCA